MADNFFHTVQWLDICGRNGITLNPEPSKFRFCQNYVEFAGFEVTLDSVHPCKRFLEAITDFPSPKNITDVRSWFGLVHQASYTFSMADKMSPFSKLQTPGAKFARTKDLDDLFQETKVTIRREIENGIKIFDPSKPTCLATDWSKTCIGFWMLQNQLEKCIIRKLIHSCR